MLVKDHLRAVARQAFSLLGHVLTQLLILKVNIHGWSFDESFVLPFKNGTYILTSSSPALTFVLLFKSITSKILFVKLQLCLEEVRETERTRLHYQSEVCVVGWIHEEVDYNMQPLVFVEPKDHFERLHLMGKVESVSPRLVLWDRRSIIHQPGLIQGSHGAAVEETHRCQGPFVRFLFDFNLCSNTMFDLY